MIAETNGKKRKLERERKVIERPPLGMSLRLVHVLLAHEEI